MLTCISCSKGRTEAGGAADYGPAGGTKDAGKTLTAQIKSMAMKVSGSYRCKPGHGDMSYRKGHSRFPEFDSASEGVPYPYVQNPGCSNHTPGWDCRRPGSKFSSFGCDSGWAGLESISAVLGDVLDDEEGPKEWMAQVEPGVQITFVSLARGGNDLKRIRFSRDMFDKWQAQRWWGENFDRIMELYNIQRFNQQALNPPGRSEDGRVSTYSRLGSVRESPRMTLSIWTPRYKPFGDNNYSNRTSATITCGPKGDLSSMEAPRTTTSSKDEASISISNTSDIDSEWIEEDEPGVYITIRQLVDGTRELRRVRFSGETFGEEHAKQWWESNRDRIQSQYLC